MSAFLYTLYYNNYFDEETLEVLKERSVTSAYEAVRACLDPSQKADFLDVECALRDHVLIADFSPYATWGSWEVFHDLLETCILAYKVQRNLDISQDEAAYKLIVSASDTQRLSL